MGNMPSDEGHNGRKSITWHKGGSLLKYWTSNTIRITKRSHPPLCHVIDFRPCILYPNYKYIKSTENEFGTWRTEIRLQWNLFINGPLGDIKSARYRKTRYREFHMIGLCTQITTKCNTSNDNLIRYIPCTTK